MINRHTGVGPLQVNELQGLLGLVKLLSDTFQVHS